jgi:RimJ/RimL family protein N-acetyltransferase
MAAPARSARFVTLPSGRVFDLLRPRSDGVLDAEERAFCARANIPTGYDPAQLGWVTLLGEDDLAELRAPGSTRERFDTVARPVVEQLKACLISPAEAEARLWAAADRAVDDVRSRHDVVTLEKCYTTARRLAARTLGQFRAASVSEPASINEPDLIAAARFTFRPWELTDVDLYRRFLDNPKLWAFMPEEYPSPFTEATARALIEASRVASHHEVLAAELDGVPVGQVRLLFDGSYPELNAAEVSYWIGEKYWGHSLGMKILKIFTERSFRVRPLDLIYAWIRPQHAASIKTAERAGYRRDPFPQLSSFASETHHAGWSRWIRYRLECVLYFCFNACEIAASASGAMIA